MEYDGYIVSMQDDSIYTLDDVKKWYSLGIEAGDILKEDYPTFEDYYDSLFDMGEYNYSAVIVTNWTIDGYMVYIYGDGCNYCATCTGDNHIVAYGCDKDDLLFEVSEHQKRQQTTSTANHNSIDVTIERALIFGERIALKGIDVTDVESMAKVFNYYSKQWDKFDSDELGIYYFGEFIDLALTQESANKILSEV